MNKRFTKNKKSNTNKKNSITLHFDCDIITTSFLEGKEVQTQMKLSQFLKNNDLLLSDLVEDIKVSTGC